MYIPQSGTKKLATGLFLHVVLQPVTYMGEIVDDPMPKSTIVRIMYIPQSGAKNLTSAVTAVEGTAKTYMWLKRPKIRRKEESRT